MGGGLAILKRMMDSSHFLDHLQTLPVPAQGQIAVILQFN